MKKTVIYFDCQQNIVISSKDKVSFTINAEFLTNFMISAIFCQQKKLPLTNYSINKLI